MSINSLYMSIGLTCNFLNIPNPTTVRGGSNGDYQRSDRDNKHKPPKISLSLNVFAHSLEKEQKSKFDAPERKLIQNIHCQALIDLLLEILEVLGSVRLTHFITDIPKPIDYLYSRLHGDSYDR